MTHDPRASMDRSETPTSESMSGPWTLPSWAIWTAVTFTAAVFHLLIDHHLGLYGELSADMSPLKGLWALTKSLVLAWWLLLVALALVGRPGALRSTLIVTVIEGLLGDGLVAIIVAPPPSAAFPWQDLAHFTALIAGTGATWLLWRERQRRGHPAGGRWLILGTIALIVVNKALGTPLNLDAISSLPS